ncbi:MAG: hypothetical protein QM703_25290 [Gemmatales bacterium]
MMPSLITSLTELPALLRKNPSFAQVIAALKKGQAGTVDGAWGSSAALAAAALAEVNPGPTLIVLAHPTDLDNWSDDLETFLGRRPMQVPDRDEPGQRLRVLKSLLATTSKTPSPPTPLPPGERGVSPSFPAQDSGLSTQDSSKTQHSGPFLTSITAMMQPVPSPAALAEQSRELIKDDEVRLETLITWLVEGGYTRTEVVELPGEFSRRGGILDVYPADADSPVRLEFFGDVIDSIRRFAPETQRSQEPVDRISVTVFTQKGLSDTVPFTRYLPDNAIVLLVEPVDLREQAKVFLERVGDIKGLFGIDATFRHLIKLPSVHITALPTVSAEATCHLQIESVERFSGEAAKVAEELATLTGQVIIACPSKGEQQRLGELLAGVASGGRQPPEPEKATPSPKTRRKATAPSEVTTPQPVHSGGLRPRSQRNPFC